MAALQALRDYEKQLFGFGVHSYNRLPFALKAFRRWPTYGLECFRILGIAWSSCDNVAACSEILEIVLGSAAPEELAAMMDADERAMLAGLPEEITVYRGCYEHNRAGLSWSLDRAIAEKFPFYHRYRQPGQALLITGVAPRSRCAYLNGRNEREIVCACVDVVSVEPITEGP